MRPLTATALGTFGLGAGALAWSVLEAETMFTLRHVRLPVLPRGSAPVRVLQVSDLHLVPRQLRKIAWVQRLAALEPDLVISSGDNLASVDAVPSALAAYGDLLSFPGVFVLGSNDYFAPKPKNPARYLLPSGGRKRIVGARLPVGDLVRGFVAAGWSDLTNARTTLKVGSHLLEFVGVDDPHIKRDRYSAVAGAPDPTATLTVGLVHAPYRRVLDAMTLDGCSLIVAGHTHGGQLRVPGFGALVTNCDLPRQQASGLSRWGASYLHVSAGLGTSPYTPFRFACRPEATLMTLEPVA
ncbi:metallophosphoesterase [Spongisporangium articulatum]|uniref:Metallophosphoesterase n=1 Tax=Spongisporangium articulatum TaxID=3362603 RepID=A0ABW8AIT2_9ACTN